MVNSIFDFSAPSYHGYDVDFAAFSARQYPGPCKSYEKQVIKTSSAYQSSTCLYVQTPVIFQQYGRGCQFHTVLSMDYFSHFLPRRSSLMYCMKEVEISLSLELEK